MRFPRYNLWLVAAAILVVAAAPQFASAAEGTGTPGVDEPSPAPQLGKLRVQVTRNGNLSDATVHVYRAGTWTEVATGRTYRKAQTNPQELELAAGTYDIRIRSIEIAGTPTAEWKGVSIGSGEVVERQHDFVSGTIRIEAENGGRPVEAVVQVENADTKASRASGRTSAGAKSATLSVVVSPGRYRVRVTPVNQQDGAMREVIVMVGPGGTSEQVIDFAASAEK